MVLDIFSLSSPFIFFTLPLPHNYLPADQSTRDHSKEIIYRELVLELTVMSSPAPPVLKEEQQLEPAENAPAVSQEETTSSPAATPSNQANVEKMLQVFQQFASNQQGSQQGKTLFSILL